MVVDEDNRFMKQLRTQYPLDWPLLSEVQREHRRQQVFSVVVTQLTDLLAIVESGEDGEVEGAQRLYHERDPSTAIEMNAELVECLVGVWENDNVQAVLEQYRSEDTFEDLEYFMNNTDRVLQHDSIVSVEDWSHVNLKSTGLVSQSLSLHGVRFEIHDSTRLGCEERKWRHMFDGVNSIMFLVPINEFDQSLFDDALVNSVQDDMDVFNCIVNNPYSRDANIFLIFTNISLFREKLQVLPIKICDNAHPERNRWTDYAGIEGMSETIAEVEEEAQQGIDYFRNKFLDLLEDRRHKGKLSGFLSSTKR